MKKINTNDLLFEKRDSKVLLLNKNTGRWYIGYDDNNMIEDIVCNNVNSKEKNNYLIEKLYKDNNLGSKEVETEMPDEGCLTLLILDTTSRCNLACKYCFANATHEGEVMTLKTAINALKKAIEYEKCADVLTIEFSGGEPLVNFKLIKEFLPISKEMAAKANKKLTYTVQTNGTLLNDEIINFLIENNVNIGISIDGTKDFHDKNRVFPDGTGSLECIIKNIKKIQEKGSHVSILAVISSPAQYESVIRFAQENNIQNIRTNLVNEVGRAKTSNEYRLEYERIAEKFIEVSKKIIMKEIDLHDATLTFFLWNLLQWKMHMCFRSPCGAGTNQISVAANGEIYPCQGWKNLGDKAVGSVDDEVLLNKILEASERVKGLREHNTSEIEKCRECNWKAFCGVCPREIYSCTGSINSTIGECIFEKKVFSELIWEFSEHTKEIKEYLLGEES